MTDNSNEERTLDLPNTDLPFFAYGIFKPGQLAYSKIKDHVHETCNAEINYRMKLRDGVPILRSRESEHSLTKGVIITFKENHKRKAYGHICNTLLRKLYEWKTIMVNGQEVNVLFGVDPENGSNYIEDKEESINFDGKRDPFFSDALDLIEKNLNSEKSRYEIPMECRKYAAMARHSPEESFFELQMNYMLLWSAIDRYSSLKYNKRKDSWNHERFAKQNSFRKAIRKFEDEPHEPVYSTDDLKMHEFNAEDPVETMYYYYTFRCNVVHRGKSMIVDYSKLEQACRELLEIFRDVLDDTFRHDE